MSNCRGSTVSSPKICGELRVVRPTGWMDRTSARGALSGLYCDMHTRRAIAPCELPLLYEVRRRRQRQRRSDWTSAVDLPSHHLTIETKARGGIHLDGGAKRDQLLGPNLRPTATMSASRLGPVPSLVGSLMTGGQEARPAVYNASALNTLVAEPFEPSIARKPSLENYIEFANINNK